jgi:hypothetical protein
MRISVIGTKQYVSRQVALKWVQHGSHFKIGKELRDGIQAHPVIERKTSVNRSNPLVVFIYAYPEQSFDPARKSIPALRYPQILHGESKRHKRKRHAG